MKRRPARQIERIDAPGLTITQHEGGGFTIAFFKIPSICGHGASLDAAWKQYQRSVEAHNAKSGAA